MMNGIPLTFQLHLTLHKFYAQLRNFLSRPLMVMDKDKRQPEEPTHAINNPKHKLCNANECNSFACPTREAGEKKQKGVIYGTHLQQTAAAAPWASLLLRDSTTLISDCC